MKTERIAIEGIDISARHRSVDDGKVAALVSSINAIGLQTPISVWVSDDLSDCHLVAGRHRLEAAKRLGWDEIDCFVLTLDSIDREIWEIDENLMRSELNPAQEAAHLARRKELFDLKGGKTLATPGGKQKIGFAKDVAAATGRGKSTINAAISRGEKIAPDVLDKVSGSKLDTGAYLDNIKKLPVAEQRERVEQDLARPKVRVEVKSDAEVVDEQFEGLVRAWNKAGPEARQMFVDRYIDTPIMDRRHA